MKRARLNLSTRLFRNDLRLNDLETSSEDRKNPMTRKLLLGMAQIILLGSFVLTSSAYAAPCSDIGSETCKACLANARANPRPRVRNLLKEAHCEKLSNAFHQCNTAHGVMQCVAEFATFLDECPSPPNDPCGVWDHLKQ